MLNISIINGNLKNDKIDTDMSIQEMTKRIELGEVIIVRNTFSKEKLYEVRRKVHRFGVSTPEKNPPRSAQTECFHRVDNNHPLMIVKRIAHFFRFSYEHQGDEGVFEFMHPINILRNQVAGLDEKYTFWEDWNGYLSQPAMLHYPAGGGYLANHVDPLHPQRVELVLAMSQRGEDFKSGGIQIQDGDKWVDLESSIQFGDIVMFRPDVPHQVLPIDQDSQLDLQSETGRWIMFSPIANIYNNTVNGKQISRY